MQVEQAIFAILSEDINVSSMVMSRIYPVSMNQSTLYPAIAYSVDRGEYPFYLKGGLGVVSLRVRVLSACRKEEGGGPIAIQLDQYVRLALSAVHDQDIASTESPSNVLHVQGIFPMTKRERYHDQSETFQVLSDFDVWAEEPIP